MAEFGVGDVDIGVETRTSTRDRIRDVLEKLKSPDAIWRLWKITPGEVVQQAWSDNLNRISLEIVHTNAITVLLYADTIPIALTALGINPVDHANSRDRADAVYRLNAVAREVMDAMAAPVVRILEKLSDATLADIVREIDEISADRLSVSLATRVAREAGLDERDLVGVVTALVITKAYTSKCCNDIIFFSFSDGYHGFLVENIEKVMAARGSTLPKLKRHTITSQHDDDNPGYNAQSLIDAIDRVEPADYAEFMAVLQQGGGAAVLEFLERYGARRVQRSMIGFGVSGSKKKLLDAIKSTAELIDRLTLNTTPAVASTRLATMKKAFDKLAHPDKGAYIDIDKARWLFDLAFVIFYKDEKDYGVSESDKIAILTKLGLWDAKGKARVLRAKAVPLYKEIRDLVAKKLAQYSRSTAAEISTDVDDELVGVGIVNKNQIYSLLYTVQPDVLMQMTDGLFNLGQIILGATVKDGWVNALARWEWTKANRGKQAPDVMPQKNREGVLRMLGLPHKTPNRRETESYEKNRIIVLKVVQAILEESASQAAAHISVCAAKGCGNVAKSRCTACREPYCSEECQLTAWGDGHAQMCAQIALKMPSFARKLELDKDGLWTDDSVRDMIKKIPARALGKITELFEAVSRAVRSRARFDYGEFEGGKWVLDFYPQERAEGINERGELIWSFWDPKFAQLGFDTTDMRRPRDINVVSVKHQTEGSKQAIERLLLLLKEAVRVKECVGSTTGQTAQDISVDSTSAETIGAKMVLIPLERLMNLKLPVLLSMHSSLKKRTGGVIDIYAGWVGQLATLFAGANAANVKDNDRKKLLQLFGFKLKGKKTVADKARVAEMHRIVKMGVKKREEEMYIPLRERTDLSYNAQSLADTGRESSPVPVGAETRAQREMARVRDAVAKVKRPDMLTWLANVTPEKLTDDSYESRNEVWDFAKALMYAGVVDQPDNLLHLVPNVLTELGVNPANYPDEKYASAVARLRNVTREKLNDMTRPVLAILERLSDETLVRIVRDFKTISFDRFSMQLLERIAREAGLDIKDPVAIVKALVLTDAYIDENAADLVFFSFGDGYGTFLVESIKKVQAARAGAPITVDGKAPKAAKYMGDKKVVKSIKKIDDKKLAEIMDTFEKQTTSKWGSRDFKGALWVPAFFPNDTSGITSWGLERSWKDHITELGFRPTELEDLTARRTTAIVTYENPPNADVAKKLLALMKADMERRQKKK